MILLSDILRGPKPSSRQLVYCPPEFSVRAGSILVSVPGVGYSALRTRSDIFVVGFIASPTGGDSGIVSNNFIRTKIRDNNNDFLQAIRLFASSILVYLGRSRPVTPDCLHALWAAIVHRPPVWRPHVRVAPTPTTYCPSQSRAMFPRTRGKRTAQDIA